MKSFIAKRVKSIFLNLRYLRFKLLKYKENNKNFCNTFDQNFKNTPLYIMSSIIRMVLFCIIRWCPYFKNVNNKMALNPFCDETLHMYLIIGFILVYFVLYSENYDSYQNVMEIISAKSFEG